MCESDKQTTLANDSSEANKKIISPKMSEFCDQISHIKTYKNYISFKTHFLLPKRNKTKIITKQTSTP